MDRPKYVPGLAARVLRQIEEHPETWDQRWVEGGTTRCIAGWSLYFVYGSTSGPAVRQAALEVGGLGIPCRLPLADALFGVAIGSAPFGCDDDPRPWLRKLAARDEYMRTRSGGMGRGFCSALEGVGRG